MFYWSEWNICHCCLRSNSVSSAFFYDLYFNSLSPTAVPFYPHYSSWIVYFCCRLSVANGTIKPRKLVGNKFSVILCWTWKEQKKKKIGKNEQIFWPHHECQKHLLSKINLKIKQSIKTTRVWSSWISTFFFSFFCLSHSPHLMDYVGKVLFLSIFATRYSCVHCINKVKIANFFDCFRWWWCCCCCEKRGYEQQKGCDCQ